MLRTLIMTGIVAIAFSGDALAHGGGLDANGCHHDRKHGGYHCHRAPARLVAPQPIIPSAPATLLPPSQTKTLSGATKAEGLASEVQRALAALGYYEGPITGTVGPQTKRAIMEFEAAFSMLPTGRISPDLLQRLGIAWP